MNRDDWKTWNKVFLRNKKLLPEYSGIYIVTDQTYFVLYVGKSKNIKYRWNGHHRHKQLIRKDRKDRIFYIYFNHFSVEKLDKKKSIISIFSTLLLTVQKLPNIYLKLQHQKAC